MPKNETPPGTVPGTLPQKPIEKPAGKPSARSGDGKRGKNTSDAASSAPSQWDGKTPLIYFDGHCGLCNGFVDWLITKGSATQHFLFTPLQGQTARKNLESKMIKDLSTVVMQSRDQTFLKSTAILEVLKEFRGFSYAPIRALARLGLILPLSFRDSAYDWIAKRRYDFFGRRETCRIPTPDERKRFMP